MTFDELDDALELVDALELPGGDLDIVILGVSHEMTNPALGFTR